MPGRWRSLFIFCLLCAPLFSEAQGQPVVARRPNFVVILADDMGYGDIGPYGATDIRTPSLDRLAREGVKLTNAYSNGPSCTPTRAALMTGRWQQRVGLERATTPSDKGAVELPLTEPTVARMLKDAGYRTGMFGKWHLGYDIARGPLAHGFEEFFGILTGNVDMYSHRYRTGLADLYDGTQLVEREGYLTDLLTERAVAFIDRGVNDGGGEPFFLYLPYNAVHWPFQPPGNPQDVRTPATWFDGGRADYARMLEAMDAGIGRILAALDRRNLSRDTLVIFTNDNGGERLSRNAPLFHRKGTLWEGGIRVPYLLRWPGTAPAGKVSAQMTITMDLTATILAAAGVEPRRPLDGINLLPIWQGRAPLTERAFYWRINSPDRRQKAVRRGDWKYVVDGSIEMLFDLRRDVGERTDLSYRRPAVVKELRDLLAQWEKEVAPAAQ